MHFILDFLPSNYCKGSIPAGFPDVFKLQGMCRKKDGGFWWLGLGSWLGCTHAIVFDFPFEHTTSTFLGFLARYGYHTCYSSASIAIM